MARAHRTRRAGPGPASSREPHTADAMPPRYRLRLMFEWGGGCLWCGNDAARDAFDVGPVEDRLPLSPGTRRRLDALSAWHDTSLDRDDPAGPGPWPPDEHARFDRAAEEVLEHLRAQLGPDFEIEYVRL